ncbi:hypothetical protein [Streptomyces sp. NPDC126933]|uniref:hypothetical protein n=1 Tax=unclassified Streptomyces TaxID=2593676 RepID=UPI00364D7B9C
MAGTDDSVDEDALYVLTAALLTPAQFPAVLGDDYPEACAALGLEPHPEGYGLVMGQDSGGARWTVIVDDVSLVAVAIASWDCGMEYDLSPGDHTIVSALPGWPLALAVAAPGLPAPHDPEPEPGSEEEAGEGAEDAGPAPLAPPDTETWGPAQRRLGADGIAQQWAAWRERLDGGVTVEPPGPAPAGSARSESAQSADATEPPAPSHPGVRRVLEELRAYVDTAPPLGRVRSSFAEDGARMLRADGPGWSVVARTDDLAFVLLDDEPGEVLPVGRGNELPGLLKALDAMAVRPA